MSKRIFYVFCAMEINDERDHVEQMRERIPYKEDGGCDIIGWQTKQSYDKEIKKLEKYEKFIIELKKVLGLEGNEQVRGL